MGRTHTGCALAQKGGVLMTLKRCCLILAGALLAILALWQFGTYPAVLLLGWFAVTIKMLSAKCY